jgi:U4/U6 small nuclear ribonucleoprotein PRP3
MMKVLGDDAVQDPTMIEKRVREDIASRVQAGLQHNLVNKLTDEERRAKKKGKSVEDETAGSTVVVFRYRVFFVMRRIECLADKRNQFKVDANAKQLYMSGIMLVYPLLNIVVVEGGPKAARKMKRLMLERIDWNMTDSTSEVSSKGENKCVVAWEGVVPNRGFKGFYSHFAKTEARAKEILEEAGAIEYWNASRSFANAPV